MKTFVLVLLVTLFAQVNLPSADSDTRTGEPELFELGAFVVYGGEIDTIDGFTGESYHKNNPVVEGFREDFNNILRGYHRKILVDEHANLTKEFEYEKAIAEEVSELAESLGITGIDIRGSSTRRIERAIFRRLVDDPFFKIDALIVWDLDTLNHYKNGRPSSEYAQDIRFNLEKQTWERRITTEWKVKYWANKGNTLHNVLKLQGLNLDTNEGFHFINRGLTQQVPPEAFEDVDLTYPIFVNSKEPADTQIQNLKLKFVQNLYCIYDPFSWAQRRNVRFRIGFKRQIQSQIERNAFKLNDREWFDPVIAHLLNDIVTIKHRGVSEVYDFAMLWAYPLNRNILGTDLDLLNWNEGEDRSINYNPSRQNIPTVNFNNPNGARWILLDAYRRHGDGLIDSLRSKLLEQKAQRKKQSGKDLIKAALEEATGIPADVYIDKAMKAQRRELEKWRISA